MPLQHASYAAPAWEVVLPGRRRSSLGGRRPRGTLVIWPGEAEEERITLPLPVARLLSSKTDAGELHPGSRAELLYIVSELSTTCAATRVERLINRRDYSSHEIRRKLADDGYHSKVIEACVQRACASGLVSDTRFADVFVRSKVAAGWGQGRIERELARRGIEVDELEGWPYDYLDPEAELERAIAMASTRRVSGQRAYEKLVRYLCGKGYALGVSTRAAREVLARAEEGDVVDIW